jgi:flagellar hook assembly protein FlgD
VFDVQGALVKTLTDQSLKPGTYKVVWDGRDDRGNSVASGSYFCQVTNGSRIAAKKAILIR